MNSAAQGRQWVKCPICGEPDMRQEGGIITCTNLACPSNGGADRSAIKQLPPGPDRLVRVGTGPRFDLWTLAGQRKNDDAAKFYAFGIRLPCWLWRLIYGPVRMSDRPASYPHEWWRLAGPVEAGTASSAVTLTFGCGHVVNAVSGDALYHTCPFCFIDREAAK